MLEALKERGLEEGATVVVRHSDPFFDEPHQVEGEVLSIEIQTQRLGVLERLLGRGSATATVVVQTESDLGRVRIKGVRPENMHLVVEPRSIPRLS